MLIQAVKSKIHRVRVTQADLNYIGSITIDEELMNASNLIEGEKVQIVNINNESLGNKIEVRHMKYHLKVIQKLSLFFFLNS